MTTKLLAPLRTWEARRALRAARRARRRGARGLAAAVPASRLADRRARSPTTTARAWHAGSTDMVHAADERLLPGASPVDRVAVRQTRPQLLDVAARVCDVERPVTLRGVVLLERLLDGRRPLFGHGRALAAARRSLPPCATRWSRAA